MGFAYIKSFTSSIYRNDLLSLWLATSGPNLFLKTKLFKFFKLVFFFTLIHLVKASIRIPWGPSCNIETLSQFVKSQRFSDNYCL